MIVALRTALEIINHSIDQFEGGFVNHKNDAGGPTKYGITLTALSNYRNRPCTLNDVKNLKKSEAVDIYMKLFYTPSKVEMLPAVLRYTVYDMVINHGVPRAIKILQQAVNRLLKVSGKVDGIVGPTTVSKCNLALQTLGQESVLTGIVEERSLFYKKIIQNNPSQKVFEAGWNNRIKWFKCNLDLLTD